MICTQMHKKLLTMGTTKQSLDCPSLLTSLLHKSMLWQMKAPRLRSQKCSELPEMQEKESKSSVPWGIPWGGGWCSMLQEKEGALASLQSHLQGGRKVFFPYSTSDNQLNPEHRSKRIWKYVGLPAPHPLLICIPPCEEVGQGRVLGRKVFSRQL